MLDSKTEVLLVSGIANPRPLKKMLEEHSNSYHCCNTRIIIFLQLMT